jgi:hypothetical protein
LRKRQGVETIEEAEDLIKFAEPMVEKIFLEAVRDPDVLTVVGVSQQVG